MCFVCFHLCMYVFKMPLVVLVVDFSVSIAGIFDVCGAVRKITLLAKCFSWKLQKPDWDRNQKGNFRRKAEKFKLVNGSLRHHHIYVDEKNKVKRGMYYRDVDK